jgi:hypothetical protein
VQIKAEIRVAGHVLTVNVKEEAAPAKQPAKAAPAPGPAPAPRADAPAVQDVFPHSRVQRPPFAGPPRPAADPGAPLNVPQFGAQALGGVPGQRIVFRVKNAAGEYVPARVAGWVNGRHAEFKVIDGPGKGAIIAGGDDAVHPEDRAAFHAALAAHAPPEEPAYQQKVQSRNVMVPGVSNG